MNPSDFEKKVIEEFPNLKDEILDDIGLLHLQMETLYRYAQSQIKNDNWQELNRVFRFLDRTFKERSGIELENAIRVSFLEYFDFQDQEEIIRSIMEATLLWLYDDQMDYVRDMERKRFERENQK